ncbi:uncharacterized protein FFB20_10719 [Fusarium fujikuroi]|uniref:Uncharacterized protein n=2 Tax=Fusarium fujikuroi TaxID=5127 RepID=S0E319_GIBF5|nr:uncharacterized protein FFUJ_07980 [Fusarium fujikuroi IMI 58289]KLO98603.1 uncharacterized protein Y057_4083 [Fusarium fujikuroi]KLP17301.1 uncharacterized protein LW94_5318 [Fusarium fujikuroi]QGI65084.1 hypothetical protein CEK27_009055 [Fusarium fujikuroi]QGI82338.1 hypothetical protein CEK25_009067 [Fusarium fujikuroi]QGI95968.1 hypothetical protein CEK26_009037 [Fusarium fujikuroi]
MASDRHAGEDEYVLPYAFPNEEERCEDLAQLRDQTMRVRGYYQEAKAKLSRQATAELHAYLKTGEWIDKAKLASSHPAYARFMGTGKFKTPSRYYPHFFVIQAIFDPDPKGKGILKAVGRLYDEVSKHWGMQATPGVPFFPYLPDSERELRLLLGNHAMLSEQVRTSAAPVHSHPATSLVAVVSPGPARRTAASPTTQDSIVAAPPGPSTSGHSRLTITNLPIGMSPHLADINQKFLEYDQRVADLEREILEKEQQLKDKDFQMNNLGYKQRYEQAVEQLLETRRELRDTQQQCREFQILLSKYEEKEKQAHHHLSQSQSFSNQAHEAAHKIQCLLTLGQQQKSKVLNLLIEPIEEFNATAESPSHAAQNGQRTNKRARED